MPLLIACASRHTTHQHHAMNQTRNIFVMTDDGQWLEEEKAGLDKAAGWNVVGFSGERFSGKGNGDRWVGD